MSDDTKKLAAADEQKVIESGEDMANAALAAGDEAEMLADGGVSDDAAESDALANTLGHLQAVIERNATQLMKLNEEIKLKRESLRSVFENDTTLAEAQEKQKIYATEAKERKSQVASSPQASSLKVQIGELNQEKKEIEETLSNHLLNYYSMTNSTSFDTSDGDQWDFKIKAKVSSRK